MRKKEVVVSRETYWGHMRCWSGVVYTVQYEYMYLQYSTRKGRQYTLYLLHSISTNDNKNRRARGSALTTTHTPHVRSTRFAWSTSKESHSRTIKVGPSSKAGPWLLSVFAGAATIISGYGALFISSPLPFSIRQMEAIDSSCVLCQLLLDFLPSSLLSPSPTVLLQTIFPSEKKERKKEALLVWLVVRSIYLFLWCHRG